MLAATPEPPYVAVIFTTERSGEDEATFQATDQRLWKLVVDQPGYLGGESTSDGESGITVSYWRTADDARAWKEVAEHRIAQQLGQERWFRRYRVRVATVEREYGPA
jgi:heme-degrading monooxygenase HmoA